MDTSGQDRPYDLAGSRWGDVRAEKYALAVLPWGAAEPHNLHLPYLTDCLIARSLSLDAAALLWEQGIRVMVLPAVPFGSQNPGQWNKPFCIHLGQRTQAALLEDVVASLDRQGIRRLAVVNGHGGNSFRGLVRDLAFAYPGFTVAVADTFALVPQQDYFECSDDHAGEMETSLMMHYHPRRVALQGAGDGRAEPFAAQSLRDGTGWMPRDWDRVSADTGIGDPRRASAEKGSRYAEAVVRRLAGLFADLAGEGELYRR